MNREIKFRGKSLNGEWKFGLIKTINRNSGITVLTEDKTNVIREVWKCYLDTIGQFTGLKDKNGTEIYNGDILSENGNIIGVVVWSARYGVSIRKKNTTWALINFCPDSDFDCGTLSNIEVIGNIHDNPELLQ